MDCIVGDFLRGDAVDGQYREGMSDMSALGDEQDSDHCIDGTVLGDFLRGGAVAF
jgi:hypothetical protein